MEWAEGMAEPFRIKMIEPIQLPPREVRDRRIREADYNLFRLMRDDVFIDLLTDSGTSAMSDNQWAGVMLGDESYAGGRNYQHLRESVKDVLGFDYVIPTHQGRPAENILFKTLVKPGDHVLINMPFDTTGANISAMGGHAVECVIDEAYDPVYEHPFKGNMDISKLEKALAAFGRDNIPFIMITITNNSGGGQPVSMENIRQVKDFADRNDLPVFFDAARCVENAWFIRAREEGYGNRTVAEILKEEMSYADGCTFSCKKDALVNMGGMIALQSKELYDLIVPNLILQEGFVTYGGMSGRDEEALARGLKEMTDDAYISYRIGQVEYLGRRINEFGIPTILPLGGHAVFVDADAFFPHIPRNQFPAETLAAELYLECGVRGVGLGALAFMEEDEETGKVTYPELELFRLAIPRRVYTHRHMDVVAEGLRRVYERRDRITGLRLIRAPKRLKHFLAEMAPV